MELVESILSRIDAENPRIRAVVHRFDEDATAAARACDEARKRGEDVGPLAGLPIMVKESIETAGVASTLGLTSRMKEQATHDAAIVAALKSAGAIVIGKTNVSQFLMFHESDNPVFGATHNPWNVTRTSGGSSGGEAAALASGMSMLGIGTDVGGSIRVPASFCGIFGLKPTSDRWPNLGSLTALRGQEAVRGQTGPMARNVADARLLFAALSPTQLSRRDPAVPPLGRKAEPIELAKLRVGFYEENGFLAPASSVRRVVREAADGLRQSGISVVRFLPPRVAEIVETYLGLLSSDGGEVLRQQLGGGALSPQLKMLMQTVALSPWVRAAIERVFAVKKEPRAKLIIRHVRRKTVAEYWALCARRTEIRQATIAAWDTLGLDAVIAPVHATPALRHGDSVDFSLGGLDSMLYNFLNFPAASMPWGRVHAGDVPRADGGDRLDRRARAIEEDSEGLPIGVQVVARPFCEDVVFQIADALERAALSRPDFPHTPVE